MITVDILKAKEISHAKRRDARQAELSPLDIKATIPMFAEQAEADRQLVREKYDAIQIEIDAAQTVEELKTLINEMS